MNTLLLLLAGLFSTMLLISCIAEKINIIDNLVMSMSLNISLYAAISFVLLKVNQFSVNRSLMATLALILMLTLFFIIVLKRRPHWGGNFRISFIPLIFSIIIFCITVVLMNNGFFGMSESIGAAQAKALILTSPMGTSPIEADYTSQMSVGTPIVSAYLADLQSSYNNADDIMSSLMALGVKILGYTRMMYIFGIMLACGVYLFWMFLKYLGLRYIAVNTAAIALSVILLLCVGLGFSNKEKSYNWDVMDNISKIVSTYDVIIVDDSALEDMYFPLAGIAHSKTYPLIGELAVLINELSVKGERVYYITKDKMYPDVIQNNGMQLKEVYITDFYLYKNFNYYVDHSTYDYDMAYSLMYMFFIVLLGITGFIAVYGMIIKQFDTILNVMLSIGTYIVLYGLISAIFTALNIYSLAYVAVAATVLGISWAMILLAQGKTPSFSFDYKKHMVPLVLCIFMLAAIGFSANSDYYGIENGMGKNQLKALQYIFTWNPAQIEVDYNGVISSYLALAGKLFGRTGMMYAVPICFAAVYSIIAVVCERKIYKKYIVRGIETTCAIVLVLSAGIWFSNQDTYAKWERIHDYTNIIKVDDAVALQGGIYDNLGSIIKTITGVQTSIGADDYVSAMQEIDNAGNYVYYIADEVLDINSNRVKPLVNKESYMYQCYDYNTRLGVYSVSDSVTKGFYPPEVSGMAWNKDQIAYIQCNIKKNEYDTVRLYLGATIDFNSLQIDKIELEFRENNAFISRENITRENNGKYIDFKLDNNALQDGVNTIYFRSSIMWSPIMYGVKDMRTIGFPYYYVKFLNTGGMG